MQRSESISDLAAALAAFNASEISTPANKTATIEPKNSAKQGFTYKYADLAGILAAVRPALAAQGLSIMQEIVHRDSGELGCVTWVFHSTGEWLAFDPVWIGYGPEPKELGIAITYVRRYALMAALGLAGEDDGQPPKASGARPAHGNANATGKQVARILSDAEAAGISEGKVLAVANTRYGLASSQDEPPAETLARLSKSQASEMIDLLGEEADRRHAAAAAGADPETGEVPPAGDDNADYWPTDEPPGMDAGQWRDSRGEGSPT